MTAITDQLGPFQEFWDAWNEAGAEIRDKPFEHFPRAAEIQFEEMRQHLSNDDRLAAAREAADVISIALNAMRWLGYQPADVAKIVRDRAENRMRGQTHAILEKYKSKYGI